MGKLIYVPGERPNPSGNQLVTLDDLDKFRVTLMMDIKKMLEGHLSKTPKRWLKSYEVREMLKISPGTLHSLRNNGKIPFTRIGGLIYYDASEIDRVLQDRKQTA
ncbi:MAG TPA: helix-turn-helix domain-containing protein [Puia sp.]|jgi:predicted DNA-binding transcriptional regulator AlpA|nr:helix-turn-helix domain-containing protein [Puia sp.]